MYVIVIAAPGFMCQVPPKMPRLTKSRMFGAIEMPVTVPPLTLTEIGTFSVLVNVYGLAPTDGVTVLE